jgi:hypothetical protein
VERVLLGSAESSAGSEPVIIAELSSSGCEILKTMFSLNDRIDQLWIGAVGPLPISRCRTEGARAVVEFSQPLASGILRHFTNR